MPRTLNAPQLIAAVGGKTLHIPPEGWNAGNFLAHGSRMIFTLARVAKVTQRRAAPAMARGMTQLFSRQLQQVIDIVVRRRGATVPRYAMAPDELAAARELSTKADEVLLNLGAHEDLWAQAINSVMKDAGAAVVSEVLPTIQSVMSQGYSKTSILMGQDASGLVHPIIARRARNIAQQVTVINDTTRNQMIAVVRSSVADGLTVSETAAAMEQTLPGLFGNRALTIARTELNKAWTQGAITSFQQSSSLTHVSVIGCESREEERWKQPSYKPFLYKGESTCNAVDIPIGDLDTIQFHPNHTGNMVPSRFRNADGTVPDAGGEDRGED